MVQRVKDMIKEGAEQILLHPHKPYDFKKDVILGEQCELYSQYMFEHLGAHIERCDKGELNKDFIGTYLNKPFELEVKGDFKSLHTGNIFLEFLNTKNNTYSGIMCGDTQCLWHHYFFTQGDYTHINILCSNKGFMREMSQRYKDTIHFQPKTISNARGYAVAQSFLFELCKRTDNAQLNIIKHKL